MIKNKAIVNEENSDAEYWRQKYLALVKKTDGGDLEKVKSENDEQTEV